LLRPLWPLFHNENGTRSELYDPVRAAPDQPFIQAGMASCANNEKVGGDTEDKIEAFLPVLDGMMRGGLVTLEKVQVLQYGEEVKHPPR
jgi:hypothetical protein